MEVVSLHRCANAGAAPGEDVLWIRDLIRGELSLPAHLIMAGQVWGQMSVKISLKVAVSFFVGRFVLRILQSKCKQSRCNQREVVAVCDTSSTSIPGSLSYCLIFEESPGSSMTLVNKYVKYEIKTETEVVSILFHPTALRNPATLILTERRRSFLSHTR